jgi:hypothetical protein
MHNRLPSRTALVAALVLVWAASVRAQTDDAVGIRAQGMGGAFTAVADDATATWWNPAGLAGGAYFGALVEYGGGQDPRRDRDAMGMPVPAWRTSSRAVTAAFPALGLSFYRFNVSEIEPAPTTGTVASDRQEGGYGAVRLTDLHVSQFSGTVGQSLGDHVVIGSTVKLLRGSTGSEVRNVAGASLDEAGDLEAHTTTRADIDVGVMATLGSVKVGAAVRNASAPTFGDGQSVFVLRRHARVGASIALASCRRLDAVTVAIDADLTTSSSASGDRRHVSGGVEAWVLQRRLGFRGGMSANTIGEARPTASGGLSVALRSGLYLDGEITGGADRAMWSGGIDLRTTF